MTAAATLEIERFAAGVRADRRANPGIAGDGTRLELLLAPRCQDPITRG